MIKIFGGVRNSSQLRCSPFGSANKRVSGSVPSALRPNAFARFITVKLFSSMMSEGTSDTRQPLGDSPPYNGGKLK